MSKVDVLLGLQWGDEGKGKIVDVLTPDYDVVARFQGGPNAGHTLEFNGIKHVLHIIPSGIFHAEKINVIGNGVLIEPCIFKKEISDLAEKGVDATKNLYISKKAHLILPSHRMLDAANEQAKGNAKIGSTLKGIGPAYTDKIARTGLRVGDIMEFDFREKYEMLKSQHLRLAHTLNFDIADFRIDGCAIDEYERMWLASLETLKKFNLINSEYFINRCLDEGKRVLAEGAQGCAGPFPTELFDETGAKLCNIGHEFGATTGRPRRCGWIDIPALRYACMLNGVTHLFVTKPDVMNDFDEVKMCTHYQINGQQTDEIPFEFNEVEIVPQLVAYKGWKQSLAGITDYNQLPQPLLQYLAEIERVTGVPIRAVSISPDRKDVLFK